MVGEMRFELIKPVGNAINKWWVELESNQPSHKASDLQSDPLPATEYRPILIIMTLDINKFEILDHLHFFVCVK